MHTRRQHEHAVLAPLLSAGERAVPRIQPGELRPQGVAKWLKRSKDYDLLYNMAAFGADMRHRGPLPTGLSQNRVRPEHEAEVERQLQAEIALGWLRPVQGDDVPDTANAPMFLKEEPGKFRLLLDFSDKDLRGEKRGVNRVVALHELGDAPMARPRDLGRTVLQMWDRHGAPPLLLVRDWSKAFRRIAVREEDRAALHVMWRGRHYPVPAHTNGVRPRSQRSPLL